MLTPEEWALKCWEKLPVGPGVSDVLHERIIDAIRAAVAAAVAEEREACAVAADLAYGGDNKFVAAIIRSRASGGNGEPVDRTVLRLADVAERQGRPKVAQWLRDYFWNSAQGERLRVRTRGRNDGESGN